MDWITLLIEVVGVVILLLWIVIPIQEFRSILKQIQTRGVSLAGRRSDIVDVRNRREPHA